MTRATGLLDRRRAAVLLSALLCLTGCVALPVNGPVHTEAAGEQVVSETSADFIPNGPTPGAPPGEIVRGFLVAMQAIPLSTTVARRFLTEASSTGWVPEKGTIIYSSEQRDPQGNDVRLTLKDTRELDARGAWLGKAGKQAFTLDLVRERGEWRISEPPDRLIIPLTHFQTRFTQYSLFFFDKSASVLVPEPVHVPSGPQATTFLVNALLEGPKQRLLGVERTFIPARTTLDDISVPVSREGVVQVPLSDDILDLDPSERNLAFAQIAWTVGQVPGVRGMRVTVDGSPLELRGVGADPSVNEWSEYSPAVTWASQELFGIRAGKVVAISGDLERRVSGAAGSLALGLEKIGIDLAGQRIAGTTGDGRVLLSRRSRAPGTTPSLEDVTTVLSQGTSLLKPAWDLHGRLWLVDRAARGAVIYLVADGAVRQLAVEGLTGADIRSFVLSRDGTRFVAEVREGERDRLVQARIERDQTGRVRRLSSVTEIPLEPLGVRRVRDLAWRSPDTLAVLTAPSGETAQVLVVKVDGSTTPAESTTDADVFEVAANTLVTTSALGAPLYLRTPNGQMFALASNGRWTSAGIEPGLRSPTFPG
jgi:hypothetical protein